MATKKKRITVNLDPNLYETLKRLAELQGQPLSGSLNDLLGAINEPLQRTVGLMDAAQQAPKQVREGLRQTVDQLDKDLRQSMDSGQQKMDGMQMSMDQSNPHVVTRGSGQNQPTQVWDGNEYIRRQYQVVEEETGHHWMPGLSWPSDSVLEALEKAKKSNPEKNWVVRESWQ